MTQVLGARLLNPRIIGDVAVIINHEEAELKVASEEHERGKAEQQKNERVGVPGTGKKWSGAVASNQPRPLRVPSGGLYFFLLLRRQGKRRLLIGLTMKLS